jgi:hypothetical protein
MLLVPIIYFTSSMKGDFLSSGNLMAILIALAISASAFYGYYSRTVDLYKDPSVKKFLSFKDSGSLIRSFEAEINGPPLISCKGSKGGFITQNFVFLNLYLASDGPI